ncbi:MAG: cytochrome c [Hyphomicrobiaceae bacterium]|nr:MAG: cytochrome c [Hyphomicrobiaceae bacterium]
MVVLAGLLAFGTSAWALEEQREKELTNLVRQDCGSCHGMTLKGGLGRSLARERISQFDDDTLVAIILGGVPGTPMPPWRGLITDEEVRWIVGRLKTGFPE